MTKLKALLVVVATLSLVFSACGKDKSNTDTTSSAKLPTLKIGSDIEYAPNEFFKEGTEIAQGMDIDLGKALAKELLPMVEGKAPPTGRDSSTAGLIDAIRILRNF
jgi:ABC-type amino acid transport substrate-binding protein